MTTEAKEEIKKPPEELTGVIRKYVNHDPETNKGGFGFIVLTGEEKNSPGQDVFFHFKDISIHPSNIRPGLEVKLRYKLREVNGKTVKKAIYVRRLTKEENV
ncbi:hypothetical protein [Leptospira levettii]|uniref:hypothetical protein n=1 Tax=Leptospira levettii TaxID=2023178 RepID=UPI0013FDBEE2|nr:hypothetical protein [Leptospira levettii]